MKIKSNTFERNNEFLLKHPALWKENETNLICNTSIDNLNFKHKSKSIRLNIVVENHIFWVEEMLMECENLFTTVVCTSHDATVLSLKFDDITKLISFNDANKRLNEYWYNILTLFSENLEKWINLEEVNYIISNNNRESIPKDKSFEDINYKIYLSEEYQFYKSLKDQNIISTVKETVQRFSPKNRVNSPTLFYRQIWLDGDRRQSWVTPKPLNTQKQFLLPDLKDEMIPKKPLSKYPKFGHRGSSWIKTVRYSIIKKIGTISTKFNTMSKNLAPLKKIWHLSKKI